MHVHILTCIYLYRAVSLLVFNLSTSKNLSAFYVTTEKGIKHSLLLISTANSKSVFFQIGP